MKELEKKIDIRKYGMFIALVVIAIFFQFQTNGVLLTPMNIARIVMQNSYILLLAIGMLPIILTGNIDLSVGSILAIVSSLAGVLIVDKGFSVGVTIGISLLLGILVGAWQGFWVAYVRVPSFIVTLAGMLVFRGITMAILQGNTLAPFPPEYQFLASGFLPAWGEIGGFTTSSLIVAIIIVGVLVYSEARKRKQSIHYNHNVESPMLIYSRVGALTALTFFAIFWLNKYQGIPIILILLGVLVAVYSFITQNTVLGRSIYALGGNERATQLSGINTNRVLFLTFVNMGLLAAVAGIIFSGRLNAAAPSAGDGFELDAIAACYIGGASASGGVGTIIGAIIGGLVMGILNNGMSIVGIGIDWQQVIKGLVLLAAVAFDIYSRRKKA